MELIGGSYNKKLENTNNQTMKDLCNNARRELQIINENY